MGINHFSSTRVHVLLRGAASAWTVSTGTLGRKKTDRMVRRRALLWAVGEGSSESCKPYVSVPAGSYFQVTRP